MRVIVSGATGLIGKAVCNSLLGDGHEIVVLSRNPERVSIGPDVKAYKWLPMEGPPGSEAFEGVDAVIHLAGESVAAGRWTQEQKRRIRDSRVIGTRNLVEGLKGLSVRPGVMIAASAVGYYGDRGDELLDEQASPGKGFLSDVGVEWERESMRAHELGLRVCLLRTGVVLSRKGGALEKMILPFRLGLGGRLGAGSHWFPWIHIDDVVGIINHALTNEQVKGPINAVAPEIVKNAEFTNRLAEALNRPVFLSVPVFALRVLMGEMADVILASQRVKPEAIVASGYNFKFPGITDALRDVIE